MPIYVRYNPIKDILKTLSGSYKYLINGMHPLIEWLDCFIEDTVKPV